MVATLAAVGSALSLLMFAVVLLCVLRARRHERATALLAGPAAQLLLGGQVGGACFNGVSLWQWLSADEGAAHSWLHDFGLSSSSFYFLALALHLLSTTRSPFSPPSTLPLHAAAVGCAVVAATTAALATLVLPAVFACYTLALVVIAVAARMARTMGQEHDEAFTRRHIVVARGLRLVLLVEASYVALEALEFTAVRLFGTASSVPAGGLLFGLLASLQDAVVAAAWLLADRRLARALGAHGDNAEIAPGLRRQLLHLIATAVCDSVEDARHEAQCGESAGALGAAECAARGEYARTTTSVVRRATARSWRIEVRTVAPRAFHELRQLFGIEPEAFATSVGQHALVERFTEGRSGAFLYFSADKRYILKTATPEEMATLLALLPHYHAHVQANPDTLINRLLGAYQLELYGKAVSVVVIESSFQTERTIHERFDLKGSWVGRSSSRRRQAGLRPWEIDYSGSSHLLYPGVRKDLDVPGPLLLADDAARRLGAALRADAAFLAANRIIDYSLLVGVSKASFDIVPPPVAPEVAAVTPFFRQQQGGLVAAAVEGPAFYCLGLIDVLQVWNRRKRVEHFVKRRVLCAGPGVSVCPPEEYARRFVDNVVGALIERRRRVQVEPDLEEAAEEDAVGVGDTGAVPSGAGVELAAPARAPWCVIS